MNEQLILVRTGDSHPAHSLTYFALLVLDDEARAFIRAFANTGFPIPAPQGVVRFFNDEVSVSAALSLAAQRRDPLSHQLRQLGSAGYRIVPDDEAQVLSQAYYADDENTFAIREWELDLSEDHEVQLYYRQPQGQDTAVEVRFKATLEDKGDGEPLWEVWTDWLPLNVVCLLVESAVGA